MVLLFRALGFGEIPGGKGLDRVYTTRYFLSPPVLESMADLKRQFAELLHEIGAYLYVTIIYACDLYVNVMVELNEIGRASCRERV